MVVHPINGQLRLTLQTDHALATAELATAWGGGPFATPAPLEPVRLAAAHHDAGWTDWERSPRLRPDTRRPYDFLVIPQDLHTRMYSRSVEVVRALDPYAGLLVSLHGAGLYQNRYGYMPHLPSRPVEPAHQVDVDRFLAAQTAIQAELVATLKPEPSVLWTHYRWLQAWDMLSLMLCMFEPQPDRRFSLGVMPHHPGGPEVEISMRGVGPATWAIDPFPFSGGPLTLSWPVRLLPDQPYESDDHFQALFAAAPLDRQTVHLVPA